METIKKITAYYINTKEPEPKVIEVKPDYREYQKLCNSRVIDIVNIKIGGKPFDIICDDEFLLKSGQQVTALNLSGQPVLLGNLIICNFDDSTGEEKSITEADIIHLLANTVILTTPEEHTPKLIWPALTNLDYSYF